MLSFTGTITRTVGFVDSPFNPVCCERQGGGSKRGVVTDFCSSLGGEKELAVSFTTAERASGFYSTCLVFVKEPVSSKNHDERQSVGKWAVVGFLTPCK